MIPARWLPSLPPPANGWLPVHYEVSEDSGILRQGEYRVVGNKIWARNDAGMRFMRGIRIGPTRRLPARCSACWTTGGDGRLRRVLDSSRFGRFGTMFLSSC